MKRFVKSFFFIVAMLSLSCNSKLEAEKVYKTKSLSIQQIATNTYVHTSILSIPDYGDFPCNGVVFINEGEAIVIDTPPNDSVSAELITWINEEKNASIKAVVPSHFHNDCLGGLKEFHKRGITSYANERTIELAKEDQVEVPMNALSREESIIIGMEEMLIRFMGAGHTEDNCIAIIPSDQVLFGGCLVKEIGAGKGYLGDANTEEWSNTVRKIKMAYPEIETIVPGHGKHGDIELLDYTIELFQEPNVKE